MSRLADEMTQAPLNGTTTEDVGQRVGDLAVEMRGMMTPVIGYLELISQEDQQIPTDRHLNWITTIERRLAAMQELNDQISSICGVLRESVTDREAAIQRDPEAPQD
jgi:hypothetical protein